MPKKNNHHLKTNFNHKLNCNGFIHIVPVSSAALEYINKEITMGTHDNSFPATRFKLIEISKLPLKDLSNALTVASHGITRDTFISKFLADFPNISLDTEVLILVFISEKVLLL